MSPTFELTLSFCFFGVLFLAPLHSSFLIRSFHPVASHFLLQSILLSFLVFSLFYSSSLDAVFFSAGLTLPSCFFLVGFGLGCFSLLLFPFFVSLGFFCSVSLSGVFGGPTLVKVDFFCVIELINAKGGFSCGKNGKKKQVKQRDAGVCSIKSEMRYPSFNGTRGCAKLAQKHAMEKGGKTRNMAENAIKIAGFWEN